MILVINMNDDAMDKVVELMEGNRDLTIKQDEDKSDVRTNASS